MTVLINKPGFNLREALTSLKRKIGLKGAELVAANTVDDVYLSIGTRRNLAINGNFDVWQRGTSLSASGAGGQRIADGWVGSTGGGGATTFSRQHVAAGDELIAGPSKYYYRHNQTTANGTNGRLGQAIENVMQFSGKTITLSFWARSNIFISGANANFDVWFRLDYGTGGSPTSAEVIGGTRQLATNLTSGITFGDLTTGWKKYSVTVSIPSLLNKTLGTNNNDNLYFEIRMPGGTGSIYTVDFAQMQLEFGPTASPFEVRLPAQELLLCQRYFWDTGIGGSEGRLTGYVRGNAVMLGIQYPVQMRVAASGTQVNTNTPTIYWGDGNSSTVSSFTISSGKTGAMINVNLTATNDRPGHLDIGTAIGAARFQFAAELI